MRLFDGAINKKRQLWLRRRRDDRYVAAIDGERRYGNLSSAIRLYVLDHYRRQVNGILREVVEVPTAPLAAGISPSGNGDHQNP